MTKSNMLEQSIRFPCGATMPNRFMLAPMTNCQSHEDGRLSDDEYRWLTRRAEGGFGLTMTCASHVQAIGKGFPGQLGIFSDDHLEGHRRLAAGIKQYNGLAVIQLHHAGMRSPEALIGERPVSASDHEKTNSRALTLEEVHQLRDDFIAAARRAQQAGYDGVEVHGAHGYIITQFLSEETNHRTDDYGGSYANRARLLLQIVDGIRKTCGRYFLLGVRLSPEKFGLDLVEIRTLCQQLMDFGQVDFLDVSLWDVFKQAEDERFQDRSLLTCFTELDRKEVKLTVAGKIRTGADVQQILEAGVDFVTIGRSAIVHHDFPKRVMAVPDFTPMPNPVSAAHLKEEGLSETFIQYMRKWPGFVEG